MKKIIFLMLLCFILAAALSAFAPINAGPEKWKPKQKIITLTLINKTEHTIFVDLGRGENYGHSYWFTVGPGTNANPGTNSLWIVADVYPTRTLYGQDTAEGYCASKLEANLWPDKVPLRFYPFTSNQRLTIKRCDILLSFQQDILRHNAYDYKHGEWKYKDVDFKWQFKYVY